ncbi:winged helix-turn-helix domain-containing protein [Enterococcus sp. AZ072]|uniref:winged helix-turn-helix domain-containing protein n=1 Tax=unclassified Enterococcus TaxID=2608891 RepID=UPI003D2E1EB9
MSSVLILTKNILVEQKLQTRLQRLNCEVFSSPKTLSLLIERPNEIMLASYFDCIIVSETVTNEELQWIMPSLRKSPKIILRKVDQYFDSEAEGSIEGINGVITDAMNLEELRESLYKWEESVSSEGSVYSFDPRNKIVQREVRLLSSLQLTKMEARVLSKLYQTRGEIISREELCEYIWGDGASSSHLSQISWLMKRIRTAFEKDGAKGATIETHWGKGYSLSNEVYECYAEKMKMPVTF